ncbi:MAG: hypothetical protein IPO57_08850 [Rhodocyclales bacterium]|nr:hypothetical protein [Rhodocyclales bacterium]
MLNTYSEYIDRYLSKSGLSKRPCPGEHHFVSAYLVPRLFKLNQRVPDYINPDGTKGIIGDIVYYKDHEHQFGIEAKLSTIRLTRGEFNEWVVTTDPSRWPHIHRYWHIWYRPLFVGRIPRGLYFSGDRKQYKLGPEFIIQRVRANEISQHVAPKAP